MIDIAVVGGGPAGLSAALWAARYRRCVLFDGGEQRNRWTQFSHGYLGVDGIAPSELLERARRDLQRYSNVEVRDHTNVIRLEKGDGDFLVRLSTGEETTACRLVLAPGIKDVFPEVEGFLDHFGASVFTCGSCDGYESRDKQVVVLGHTTAAVGFALGLLDWASVTLVTNGEAFEGADEARMLLADNSIQLIEDTVNSFEGPRGDLRSAVLLGGDRVSCQVAFFTIGHILRSELFEQLGCSTNDEGCVVVDDQQQTTVTGVFAAEPVNSQLPCFRMFGWMGG